MTLSEDFLTKGIVKIAVENPTALNLLKNAIFSPIVPIMTLNEYRLMQIKELNSIDGIKQLYFSLAKNALHEIVGNELVMQRNINLSIQIPNDDSSLLPVHCDTWSGDSPYEVVLWVPFVDCSGTKSMFFCDKEMSEKTNIRQYKNSAELYKAVEPNCTFMDCKYGEALIFTQNIMHGNVVNTTDETRWSLNCRFKGLFSPYADKKLGEFFEPIEIRPATKFGLEYEYPTL